MQKILNFIPWVNSIRKRQLLQLPILIYFFYQTTWPLFLFKKITEMYLFGRILWLHCLRTHKNAKNRLFCPLFFLPNRLLSPIFSTDTCHVPIRVSLLEETECTCAFRIAFESLSGLQIELTAFTKIACAYLSYSLFCPICLSVDEFDKISSW